MRKTSEGNTTTTRGEDNRKGYKKRKRQIKGTMIILSLSGGEMNSKLSKSNPSLIKNFNI